MSCKAPISTPTVPPVFDPLKTPNETTRIINKLGVIPLISKFFKTVVSIQNNSTDSKTVTTVLKDFPPTLTLLIPLFHSQNLLYMVE